ncbi:MAG: amidohydrolase [Planctomycetaceae bacterium]|nr:amidohydrolase [Planctomycetaceae bacterium]
MKASSNDPTLSRRRFLASSAVATAAAALPALTLGARTVRPPVIDTHMHAWSGDPQRFPFDNPNSQTPHAVPKGTPGTAELLLEEMDEFGVTQCVIVQVIYHGWDNRYTAYCVKEYPTRFKGHGLIDPTDPDVADKLEYWMTEQGLSGMRFSPIYYIGKDDWMNGPAHHRLFQKASELKAIFNYFISTPQLPKLEEMVAKYPGVRIVIDHEARVDLKVADPLPEFQKLLTLAKYPNVWCKVSELSSISLSMEYPYRDTFPWVRRMYDAFGPDRLLWGTGFPGITRVENSRPDLQQELDLVRKEIDFFTPEDQVKILGVNAQKLWGFPELA